MTPRLGLKIMSSVFKNVHSDLTAAAFSPPALYPTHSSQMLKMF